VQNGATKEKGIVTAEILKNVIVDANTIPMTLLSTGEEERERLRLRSIRINSTSSYRQSKTSQLNLREFIGLRGMNDIAFEDLTEEFGKSYKLFLIGKGYSASNTNHNLCWLQRLVYIAVDRGLLKFNPLENVGYEKKGSPKRRHTFGVNMVTSGISMESVAKMMGHSNLRSTQIYAVITDNKISIDMDKLMQRRKTKETDQKRNKVNKNNNGIS
jgi:hypothetical protein